MNCGRGNSQRGSALLIVLVLSAVLLLIIQGATQRTQMLDRELRQIEQDHNRTFRQSHPRKAVPVQSRQRDTARDQNE